MGDTEHHPILTWWTHRSLGDPASASRLLMWVLSMRLELLGPFTVDSMKKKNHQPNEMCKKQTSPFRCAFRTHTGASWANDHELSIIIYLLVGFHGGSLLLIHPVLYRTSSGYGAPSAWPLRCLGPNSVMPKSQSFALSSASSTTFARRRRGADFRSTHPSFEVVKAIFLYVPSGYLLHSHGIDGPFIDGLPILKMVCVFFLWQC